MALAPNLSTLPPPQQRLWKELGATPDFFTLYGGTALALRLGHRTSVDFDFFSNEAFDPDELMAAIPYLKNSEKVQSARNTLTCRVHRGGTVLISFFGALGLGQVMAAERVVDISINIASLLDIAGTKAAVVQKRAELKDYLDIDAILRNGLDLATMLASGGVVYGSSFNPLITLKALTFFEDVPALPKEIRDRLREDVAGADATALPSLVPYRRRSDGGSAL